MNGGCGVFLYSIQRELSFRGEFSVITLKGAILTQAVTTLTSWLRSDSKITGCVLNRRGILLFGRGGGGKEGGGGEGDAEALKRKVLASSCQAGFSEASMGQGDLPKDPHELLLVLRRGRSR